MAAPDNRVPVRIARGTKAVLDANIADLYEGEICYATDENICYVKEGSTLEPASGGAAVIGDLNDVNLTGGLTGGEVLVYDIGNTEWVPGAPPAQAIDALNDVDTSTTPPTDGQALVWNNVDSEWQPGTISAGVTSVNSETGAVSLGIQDLDDYQDGQAARYPVWTYDTNGYDDTTPNSGFVHDGSSDFWYFHTTDNLGGDFESTLYALSNGASVSAYKDNGGDGNFSLLSTTTVAGTINANSNRIGIELSDQFWGSGISDGDQVRLEGAAFLATVSAAPTDGQVLTFNSTSSRFEPTTPSAGGAVSSVAGKTGDVTLASPDLTDVGYVEQELVFLGLGSGNPTSAGYGRLNDDLSLNVFADGGVDCLAIFQAWAAAIDAGGSITVQLGNVAGSENIVGPYVFDSYLRRTSGGSVTSSWGSTSYVEWIRVAGTDTASTAIGRGDNSFLTAYVHIDTPAVANDVLTWDGTQYIPSAPSGISDAPSDGTTYVRQDAGWVSGGGVNSVNTLTGAVSVGVDDLDDYGLKAGVTQRVFPTARTGQTIPNASGEWSAYNDSPDYLVVYTGGFDAEIAALDTLASGDLNIINNSNTYNTDVVDAVRIGEVYYLELSDQATWDALRNSGSASGSLTLEFPGGATPLAGGDILQYDATATEWQPTPFNAASTRALLGIGEYVDDAAAGTGGVASGAMYYNTTSSDYRLKS